VAPGDGRNDGGTARFSPIEASGVKEVAKEALGRVIGVTGTGIVFVLQAKGKTGGREALRSGKFVNLEDHHTKLKRARKSHYGRSTTGVGGIIRQGKSSEDRKLRWGGKNPFSHQDNKD